MHKRYYSLMAILLCVILAGPAHADDGCANESNDRITPELALCSVHAYNIGLSTNPDGADKQLMKEIVALKTTIIAQQMNKQYEYMDAMIRRFKIQLEKAVLTTKLQAAGAAPDATGLTGMSSSGAYGTGGRTGSGTIRTSNGLSNAEDCANSYGSTADVMQCLLRNITKVQSAVSSGDLGTARRQLKQDMNALVSYNHSTLNDDASCKTATGADNGDCARAVNNGSNRNSVTTCLGAFRACIIKNTEAIQRQNNQQQYRPY